MNIRPALKSGITYGLGLALGTALAILLNTVVGLNPNWWPGNDTAFLLSGFLLAFVIYAVAGGIGGFIGGRSLPVVGKSAGRWGYAWRGALSLGIPYSIFIFLSIFVVSLFVFYSASEIPSSQFAILFSQVGALFGALSGLVLGLLTIGFRRSWRVIVAGLIGFGLGGVALGLGVHAFLLSVLEGSLLSGQIKLVFGLGTFGFLGGFAFGLIYHRMAVDTAFHSPRHLPRALTYIIYAVLVLAIVALFVSLRPLLTKMNTFLQPRDAGLSSQLTSDTVGTHWSETMSLVNTNGVDVRPALSAAGDQLGLVWKQPVGAGDDLFYRPGRWSDEQRILWSDKILMVGGASAGVVPSLAVTADGHAHIVWRDGDRIMYSRCDNSSCTDPADLSAGGELTCGVNKGKSTGLEGQQPVIASNSKGEIMTIWRVAGNSLHYVAGNAADFAATGMKGCVPGEGVQATTHIAMTGTDDGRFVLVYDQGRQDGEIQNLAYVDGTWDAGAKRIGDGHSPQVIVDLAGRIHNAWCGNDGFVQYQQGGATEIVSDLSCLSRPELGLDSEGRIHIVWLSDNVTLSVGSDVGASVVYESIRLPNGWSAPAIVAQPAQSIQPAMIADPNGILHLAWSDNQPETKSLSYASQTQYNCDGVPLDPIIQIAYEVADQERYRPPGEDIPYCGNRYDRLLYTPNPDPAFSSQPPTPNGGYDGLADLIRSARYEVLTSTMDYDEDENGNNDSPGSVLATAIADLYHQLEADPARYPRGLIVRILLGNPPHLGGELLSSQVWHVLEDLRDAGVPEMVNPELGWRLEVANYEGIWPHSHAKITVVDGKTVVGAGFNMQYLHFPEEHASGQGKGTVDLAVQVTGPVAQDGQNAFDELWEDADQRHCDDFFPATGSWQLSCNDSKAVSDHVPEVMRYYLPENGETAALSMLRTVAYDKADQQVIAMLAAAEESIDIMHVQFSMPMICNLEYVFEVCSIHQAFPFVYSILSAAEQNGAHVRLLVDLKPFKGVETVIAVDELQAEVDARGLGDRVEIRPFIAPVHAKGTLIDGEILVVGSQNYHWSAFGTGSGLAEYSVGVSDPQAVTDFQRLFEHHWDQAHP